MVKSIIYLLFSIRGRITRKQWWLGVAICWFPSTFLWETYKLNLPKFKSGNLFWIPIALLLVCCLWMFFEVSIKRHHDRNRPESWTILTALFGIPMATLGVFTFETYTFLFSLPTGLWIIFFGCLPGDAGENRYGPPPKPLFKLKKESA